VADAAGGTAGRAWVCGPGELSPGAAGGAGLVGEADAGRASGWQGLAGCRDAPAGVQGMTHRSRFLFRRRVAGVGVGPCERLMVGGARVMAGTAGRVGSRGSRWPARCVDVGEHAGGHPGEDHDQRGGLLVGVHVRPRTARYRQTWITVVGMWRPVAKHPEKRFSETRGDQQYPQR
jgi:hypothetical protein